MLWTWLLKFNSQSRITPKFFTSGLICRARFPSLLESSSLCASVPNIRASVLSLFNLSRLQLIHCVMLESRCQFIYILYIFTISKILIMNFMYIFILPVFCGSCVFLIHCIGIWVLSYLLTLIVMHNNTKVTSINWQ